MATEDCGVNALGTVFNGFVEGPWKLQLQQVSLGSHARIGQHLQLTLTMRKGGKT